jgi:hypothetical protein
MSINKVGSPSASVDETIKEFERKRRAQRITSAFLLSGALIAVVAILGYASFRAKRAEKQANREEKKAAQATQTLETFASSTLANVQGIDERARRLCDCENPTAYLWRGGLHPPKGKPVEAVSDELIDLLQQRRDVLGRVGGLLAASAALRGYVCGHNLSVVGESTRTAEAEGYLRMERLRDPRFRFAQNWSGPPNPGWSGVIVGFFLSSSEANALQNEIGVNRSDAYPWYSCSGVSASNE